MKVLHIHITDRGGGATISVIRFHHWLLEKGIDSKLLLLNKTTNQLSETYDFMDMYRSNYDKLKINLKIKIDHRKQSKKLRGLPEPPDLFSFPYSPFDITVHPLFREADIIHLQWVANFLDYSSFFKKNKKPVVWTLYDRNVFTGGQHCITDFPLKEYQKIIEENILIKKKALRGANITIITPSKEYCEAANKSEILKKFKISIIHHGIDTNVFKMSDSEKYKEILGISKNRKIVLFSANSLKRRLKGFHILLSILEKFDYSNYQLWIIGDDICDVPPNIDVKILGYINDERLMSLIYSAADVFLSTSLEESFGLCIAESICCGTPVIAFGVGGIKDIIVHGKNGLLVDERDSYAFSKQLKRFLKNEISFDRNWIRDDAVKRFDKSLQVEKYIRIYNNIVTI